MSMLIGYYLEGDRKMLIVDNIDVVGFEPAIRGMRNPMNSWEKSDSDFHCIARPGKESYAEIGDNDLKLMKRLFKAGTEHRKYLRMIQVYMDIEANQTFWSQFDTYKIATVKNSCSKMHKIHTICFIGEDCCDHEGIDAVGGEVKEHFYNTMGVLENLRIKFNETHEKKYWRALIEILPMGFRLKATVMLSYETVFNIIRQRKNHKLDEWHQLIDELETLPYVKEIMGE